MGKRQTGLPITAAEVSEVEGTAEQPLVEKVRKWLRHQGQHLEFRVAEEFARGNFSVRQGGHILAPDGKSREIDVFGFRAVAGEGLVAGFAVVIECKYSKDKPWVVFSNPHGVLDDEEILDSALGCTTWRRVAPRLASSAPELFDGPIFGRTERHAFGGRQAFGDQADVVFGALQGVVTKARDAVREVNIHDKDGTRHVWVVLPVVVVDAPLFEARWSSEAQDIVVEQRNNLRLHWSGAHGSDDDAAVDIVAADGISGFVDRLSAAVDPMLQQLHAVAREEQGEGGPSAPAAQERPPP